MIDQYRLYPLTVTAGRSWRFVLAAVPGLPGGIDPRKHRVSITSERDYRHRTTAPLERTDRGELAFTFAPRLRGEYLVGIHETDGGWPDPPSATFAFYVADADLAGTVPRKGDLHMHTVRSDGREEPGALLARMRGLGMDFVAITDHRVYGDGGDGMLCDGSAVDLLVVPGEEINFCQGPGHIVALNARRPVTDALPTNNSTGDRAYLESFQNLEALTSPVRALVADEIERMALPEGVDRELYGYTHAIVSAIREAGGIAVIAHPFWSSKGVMDLVRSTWDHIVHSGLYDAIEVFGGMSPEKNLLSYAHYAARLGGRGVPVVASSDSHGRGSDWSGRNFTLAFVPAALAADAADGTDAADAADAVANAITGGRTTACLRVGDGEHVVAGDFALVEYSYFLLRSFFPDHDLRCRDLGGVYRSAILGDGPEPGVYASPMREALAREYRRSFPVAFGAEG